MQRRRLRWPLAFERSIALIVFCLLWELLPRLGIVSPAYLSPPSQVALAIAHLVDSGEVWKHLGASALRSISGLLLAVAGGVVGGFALGWFRRAERIVDPLYQLLRQVSAFALFPVFMLFLGIGESSKIAIIVWAAFWPVLLNTISGVKQVERVFIDCARSMGATQGFIFAKVVLPAALPEILTGIRLAGAYSITALVAAEMIGARSGLGFYTLNSQETFQIPDMYAGIVLLALFGLLINKSLSMLERRLLRWRVGLAQNG
ncbi:aliphatic sulfonates transport permease [Caballeronia arationis]|jgi:NitT/TauT family transport system permease protein|uniref:ABC-type nitrate/sulfonate/bicarbonate transport system, permease component n=1 Tax=Caballeronia arationis TaxID=1777142 RepID=A0A7Z7I382_9BURK|nr:ABC transporter permease [Caballeronia arationis]SAK90677.1 aliphatic sulfonates transport permease [Caballeronia arationis]SOE55866.1 ABC-type nitrate/sulfonate/bicarbonate transport system, permease component [Caballeronia arationis]